MKINFRTFPLMALACIIFPCLNTQVSNAGLIINFTELGTDVVANGTGNFNTSGLTKLDLIATGGSISGGVDPSGGTILGNIPIDTLIDGFFGGIIGPASFGTGNASNATTSSSDVFGFSVIGFGLLLEPVIIVADGYSSGSTLSYQATWANQTFSSLGITPGSYVWTWGAGVNADFFTINAISSVPEPASISLLALSVAGILARRRCR